MESPHRTAANPQAGFTLLEIAIVLLIIGLLTGGVLKASEMYRQAKVRKLEMLTEELREAVAAYYRSVGKLPGDDNNDSRIFGSAEINKVFPDLVNLNLITGNSTQTSREHIFGGSVTVEYSSAMQTNCMVLTGLESDILLQLDKKYDDGVAATGSVRSSGTTLYFPL